MRAARPKAVRAADLAAKVAARADPAAVAVRSRHHLGSRCQPRRRDRCDEIANATAALKTLDKNADGKLTRDEFMGKPPAVPRVCGGEGQGGGAANDGPQGPPPGN